MYIRECYNAHIPFRQVYAEYQDKITKRGLQKIWHFETWPHILPEYHTEENRKWHITKAKALSSETAAKNAGGGFDAELVRNMREAYENGMTLPSIQKKYAPQSSYDSVYRAVTKKTYKDIK